MSGDARVRIPPETLVVGIAVLTPDGRFVEQNPAWRSMDLAPDRDGSGVGGDSAFLRRTWIDQALHFRDVIAGRCKLFTCLQDDHAAAGRTLLVAMPRGAEPPHALTLIRLSMQGLLPIDPLGGDLGSASIPEPRFVMDLLVRTIEDTIQTAIGTRTVLAATGPTPAPASPAAVDDTHVALLKFLTPRQREILRLMGVGQSNTEIAEQLGISMNTVKLHVSAILRRLDLKSRMQAIALGARISQI